VWGVGCGVWGETIDNLRVNHTIKNGFGLKVLPNKVFRFIQQTLTKRLTINSFSPQPDLQKREAA
jgi:hypothetical protein